MVKFTKSQKKRYVLWAGVSGLLMGAWILFYLRNKLGFVFAIIGALILIYGDRWSW